MLKTTLLIAIVVGLVSCSTYPETPEEVVEKFTIYLSSGECDKAMDLCIGNAKVSVQATIDAGCDPYETTIDSVVCDIDGEEAYCDCFETRKSFGSISFPYELEKVDGKWKVRKNTKDLGAEDGLGD